MSWNKSTVLQQRRQRRRRIIWSGNVFSSLGFAVALGVFTLVIAVLLLTRVVRQSRNLKYGREFEHFPDQIVDVWPNDSRNVHLANILSSCIPGGSKHFCAVRQNQDPEQIALVRPPGTIGMMLDEYVRNVIQNTDLAQGRVMDFVSVSFVPRVNEFSRIIRFATIPILLEVLDLVLLVGKNGDSPYYDDILEVMHVMDKHVEETVLLDDLLEAVELLMKWHCNVSLQANDTALLTMTARMIFTFPKIAQEDLISFLHSKPKEPTAAHPGDAWIEPLLQRALDRIDAVSEIANKIQILNPGRPIDSEVERRIEMIIATGKCAVTEMDLSDHKGSVARAIAELLKRGDHPQ